eukprot:3280568-Alexandrium_andersonii.AAC.1
MCPSLLQSALQAPARAPARAHPPPFRLLDLLRLLRPLGLSAGLGQVHKAQTTQLTRPHPHTGHNTLQSP